MTKPTRQPKPIAIITPTRSLTCRMCVAIATLNLFMYYWLISTRRTATSPHNDWAFSYGKQKISWCFITSPTCTVHCVDMQNELDIMEWCMHSLPATVYSTCCVSFERVYHIHNVQFRSNYHMPFTFRNEFKNMYPSDEFPLDGSSVNVSKYLITHVIVAR